MLTSKSVALEQPCAERVLAGQLLCLKRKNHLHGTCRAAPLLILYRGVRAADFKPAAKESNHGSTRQL